ncbi:hypothetical protein [Paenibacillus oryzisoli]|uniref:Uncharacterized protein n=1 Tax=Paenibacillus oryzisoli TaxID=1850517 RepID=A0A198A177_9BACL|nr:hypothetical protein [Paenibacillus oryzisoli]OAS14857.1 hypothetical protein A8708_04980 [Paenibacillus oryzisoli]
MAVWNLFRKEVRSIFPLYGVFAMAVLLMHLFILIKSTVIDMDVTMVLALILPYLFLAAIALGTGYYQLYTEWKSNSIYLLLSLPMRGWKVLTVKLAAVIALLIVSSVWIAASYGILLLRSQWEELSKSQDWSSIMPNLFNVAGNFFWMGVLTLLLLLILVQFTYLCGQLVAKFKWIVMLIAFLGILWLVLRISPLIAGLLAWMPEMVIGGGESSDVAFLHSGAFIGIALLCIGLTALNGFIFEKEVEV